MDRQNRQTIKVIVGVNMLKKLIRRINPSILVLFIFLVSVLNVGYLLYSINDAKNHDYQTYLINKEKFGRALHIIAWHALKSDNYLDMTEYLSQALEMGDIHGCLLKKNGRVIFKCEVDGKNEIPYPKEESSATITSDSLEWVTSVIGSYYLATVYKRSEEFYTKSYFESVEEEAITQFLAYFGIALVPFLIVIYQLMSLNKKFRKPGEKRANEVQAVFKDFISLSKGLGAYEDEIDELRKDRSIYLPQVSPAVRQEIEGHAQPPYDVDVVLIRTDINGFSKIFQLNEVREPFQKIINAYFRDLTKLLARYHGQIHEFLGDEAVYIFKDQKDVNIVSSAIACIRNIHELADRYNELSEKEIGHPFRVKSSLSKGKIRYGEIVDKVGFSGIPFIESNRLLNHINDKSQNSLVFKTDVAQMAQLVCTTKNQRTVEVKSFTQPVEICDYDQPIAVQTYLHPEASHMEEALIFYRSDADIQQILAFLSRSWLQLPADQVKSVLKVFEQYRANSQDTRVYQAYCQLLESVLLETIEAPKKEKAEILSSIITKAKNILDRKSYSIELRDLLEECLVINDRRVISNALEVLTQFDSSASSTSLKAIRMSDDNRVSASLVVLDYVRQERRGAKQRLRQMLKSKNELYIASGLYALGELAEYSRRQDKAAFATNEFFQSYIAMIPKFALHSSVMVRRQAMVAAKKAHQPELLEKALKEKNRKVPQAIKDEVRSYLEKNPKTNAQIEP